MRELFDMLRVLAPFVLVLALLIFYAPDTKKGDDGDMH